MSDEIFKLGADASEYIAEMARIVAADLSIVNANEVVVRSFTQLKDGSTGSIRAIVNGNRELVTSFTTLEDKSKSYVTTISENINKKLVKLLS